MKKPYKNILRLLLFAILIILTYLIGILLINTINDYRPDGDVYAVDDFQNYSSMEKETPYSVLSWNIGYAGPGKDG